jgi:hypothetical protein
MNDQKKTPDEDTSGDEANRRKNTTAGRNPPRTTTGNWTAPKFGSAGSGGAELEPGPEDN